MRAGCGKLRLVALGVAVLLTARSVASGQGNASPPLPSLPPLPGGKTAPLQPVDDVVVPANDAPNPANPTGRQEPGISVDWIYPTTIRLGQPVTCTLVVKSLSTNRLHQVVVRSKVPAGVSVRGAEPKATTEGDILAWQIGSLEPRQEKRIDLYLVPTTKGSLPCHAFVTFTGSATARLDVRESKLAIKAISPAKLITGDLGMFAVTVSNTGDAKAEHVKVRVGLSEGLEYGNVRATEFNLDSLGANESRTVLVQCLAKAPGPQSLEALATAEFGLEAHTTSKVDVLVPRVDLLVSGPKMRYLDRHAVYTLKVTNTGTATANHVTVTDNYPVKGFQVTSASGGGHHDYSSGVVMWFLGDLEPGQAKEVNLDMLAISPGEYKNRIAVTAARGLKAAAEVYTRVEGLPGLQMELVDVEDPIEVGKDVSYEIRVTNTGTRTETNLQLVCTLPEKAEFRGAKCAAAGVPFQVQGRDVVFAPIPKLAPRSDVIFRVVARGLAPGDLRFQARIRADGLETPVLREESTRVFGDEREISAPNQK